MIQPRSGQDTLTAHLEDRYGIQASGLTELDLGVYRVGRQDGPDWVARVFAADRPIAAAEGDAALLRRLEQDGFPAERCAAQEPVSAHEGQGVLVTRYLDGTGADGSRRTYGRLGTLLGRLHTLPSGRVRDGGGWHHLVHQGSPAAEIAAARSLLDEAAPRLPADQQPLLAALRAELDRADSCADLPQALIHPDFVPANAITGPDGGLALVDWTGAGRGPRLYPLAFLLWAAGCGGPSRLDAVIAGYREHITPTDDEIGRLAGAIWARPLILACWTVLTGRKGLAETVADLAADRELAERFAAQAARGLAAGPGDQGRGSHASGSGSGRPDGPGAPAGTGITAAADGTGAGRPGGARGPSPRGTVTLDGVGGTGLTVAAVRARETARPDRLFADPLAATFAEAGGLDPDSPPGGRRAVALRVWVVGRTVFLDELLADASQQGCRQVVLLGAGFDARAFRLPWPPGTRCFEVDTPDVLGPKDEVLAAAHAEPACERVVVPCDLRDDWPAALRAAGLDPARPTAWIAEGLLVYLSAADVDRLLASVTRLSAPGSWLGLTMTTREADGLAGTRLATLRQSRAPDDPVGWLAGLGWAADLSDLREVLRAHGRPLPARPGPARPGPERPGPERPGPGRRGAADGARPGALLIRATLEPSHGHPAADQAGPGRADPEEAGPGRAHPGEAGCGRAAPDEADPGRAGPGEAGRGRGETGPDPAPADPPGNPPASRREPAAPPRQAGKPRRRDQGAAVLVADLGISAMLSQALVAFTIEFDNELERQLPHRTTWGPAREGRGPWLVSLAMWANFLRFLPPGGVPLRDVADLVPLVNLPGLERWGYVRVGPGPGDSRPSPPRQDAIVRPTRWGRLAQDICEPLAGVIEERWRDRFGEGVTGQLSDALRTVVGPAGEEWPAFLPVSGAHRYAKSPNPPAVAPGHRVPGTGLPTLLSRALMSFRAEFERDSALSLPVSANTLRVLSADGVALADLPRLAGVSREAVSLSVGRLEKGSLAVTGPDPAGGRGKYVSLTPRGGQAQAAYHRRADGITGGWRARSGDGVIDGLAGALRALYAERDSSGPGSAADPGPGSAADSGPGSAADPGPARPLISAGLVPHPDGWRANPPYARLTQAMIADPAGALPHYPMVSHRGGYPDGS
jgi:methyltransferase (TIGR00027 family)